MKPTKEQIEAVAEWWAVKTFDTAMNQNNGDKSPTGDMTFMLMNMLAETNRSKGDKANRDKFKNSIIKQLSELDFENGWHVLSVDYDPCQALYDACKESGIDCHMLPCKTHTQWDKQNTSFIGKYQYGGQFETIA